MNVGRCLAILMTLLFAAAASAAAQESAEKRPVFTAEQEAGARYYKMMLDMATATQALSVGDRQALNDKLIVIYERLVELYCMPAVTRTMEHKGAPNDPDCLGYLAKLGELYADDPVLLCAKHGIDSESCRNAYEEQYIEIFSADDLDISELDLKNKIRSELAGKDIKALTAKIGEQLGKFNAERQRGKEAAPMLRKIKKELNQDYTRLLNHSCQLARIKIVRKPVDEQKKAPHLRPGRKSRNTEDPLHHLVREFEGVTLKAKQPQRQARQDDDEMEPFAKEAPPAALKPDSPPFWRVRYLPKECKAAFIQAERYDPRLPAIVCNLEGETAPGCIHALREWRRIQKAEDSIRYEKKPVGGFATF